MRKGSRVLAGAAVALLMLCSSGPAWSAQADAPPFEHSWWQWYEASGITAQRMAEIAPNFPHPALTGDLDRDLRSYNNALLRWTYLYPHEYEAFVNAPELTALNPYYSEYVTLYRRPRFMDVAVTEAKPEPTGAEGEFEAQLYYELQLMKWTFLFHPEVFEGVYGFTPRMPEGLDVAAWRSEQLERARSGEAQADGSGASRGR